MEYPNQWISWRHVLCQQCCSSCTETKLQRSTKYWACQMLRQPMGRFRLKFWSFVHAMQIGFKYANIASIEISAIAFQKIEGKWMQYFPIVTWLHKEKPCHWPFIPVHNIRCIQQAVILLRHLVSYAPDLWAYICGIVGASRTQPPIHVCTRAVNLFIPHNFMWCE